jgi:hypothetical protein
MGIRASEIKTKVADKEKVVGLRLTIRTYNTPRCRDYY